MKTPIDDTREGGRAADWALLLEACRSHVVELGPQVATRFPGRRARDWAGFVGLMEEQGVAPLVAAALLAVAVDWLPDEVRTALRERVQLGALRARMLIQELLTLLDTLEARGIEAITYKGPPLSTLAYGRTWVRDSNDLDLVVHDGDVPVAEQALLDRGYRRSNPPPLSSRQNAAWRRTWNEYEFVSHDGCLLVDLHWRICPPRYPFRVDPRRLWSRLARTTLGGSEVRVFPLETLVVLLCLHGAKDRWSKLVWLCDIDRLIRLNSSFDWDEICGFAQESHCRRAVGLGLALAHRLLRTPLPAPVAARLAGDKALADLAGRVESRLATGGMRRSWQWRQVDMWPFHFEVLDDWRDCARYLARTLMTPRPCDWQRVPLPDCVYPLHYLVRPLRLIAGLVSESVRATGARRESL